MTQTALETLNDDILLDMVTPSGRVPVDNQSSLGFTDDLLLQIAQKKLSNSIDTQSGAPASVRAQVAAAQTPNDRLSTLQKFFPDAIPIEVFDPEYGASKFGRGNFVFTNPETGQLTLFDEDIRLFGVPIPTLGDIADVGPEIAETVGGITAGTLAAGAAGTATSPTVVGSIPAATAAFIAGEGIGSATAREAYISILDYFGETEDNRTGLERLSDFSTTAVLNAAMGPIVSKLFEGVKFVAGAPIRYANNALSVPAKEAYERLVRTGVTDPTVGQVTSSPLANLFENAVLSNLPTSTVTMRQNAEQTIRQIEEAAQKLTEKYGGARTSSEAAERVMGAAQAARDRYDAQVRALYSEVDELMPLNVSSDGKNTIQFVEKYLADSKTATGKDDLDAALRLAEKLLQDAKNGALNFNRLQAFRSSVMNTVRKAESQGALNSSERKIKELIPYITQDLDDLVQRGAMEASFGTGAEAGASAAGRTILDKFKAANAFVAENSKKGGDIAFVDATIRKGQERATQALNYVLSGARDSGDSIEILRRQFDPDEFNVISGYMLGKMGTPTPGQAGAVELGEAAAMEGRDYISASGFSPRRFLFNWNNLSKEAKEALFYGTEYEKLVPALDDLTFTLERVARNASDMANPSGTARAVAAMGMFGVLGGDTVFGKALGSDGFEYGFGGLIGPYAAAKLMTNQDFVKWVSTGVEKAVYNPKSFGQHVRRLYQIYEVNPDIRDGIKAVLHGMTQDTIEPLPNESSQSAPSLAPKDNELGFRQVVPKSTADKILPSRIESLEKMNQVAGAPPMAEEISMFEPLPEAQPSTPTMGQIDPAMSPTILPSDKDRELAMRLRGPLGGIASLA
jgi:hypothetical protein